MALADLCPPDELHDHFELMQYIGEDNENLLMAPFQTVIDPRARARRRSRHNNWRVTSLRSLKLSVPRGRCNPPSANKARYPEQGGRLTDLAGDQWAVQACS